MRFKIDWASLIAGSKFTVFALFYFVFESNFLSTSPRRGPGYFLFHALSKITLKEVAILEVGKFWIVDT